MEKEDEKKKKMELKTHRGESWKREEGEEGKRKEMEMCCCSGSEREGTFERLPVKLSLPPLVIESSLQ